MIPWWARGAEEVHQPDPNEEGGSIYPEYHQGSGVQSSRSVYSNRRYNVGPGNSPSPRRYTTHEEEAAELAHAKMLSELVYYILVKMEPTDRCLRLPGDIFDPKRLNNDGLETRWRA